MGLPLQWRERTAHCVGSARVVGTEVITSRYKGQAASSKLSIEQQLRVSASS
ncbi:predicted protein [Histoplasma mississippiense (nom. inval.)]|uniref:predicted protein n=1 Tax=Ajellomyces capsulatus (strain NAm1 / WU24) TaxID=2059318 RepID=UPI000157D218|nr:predicted protein [Histoplasma mississippiense (nom. inval.)]EDN04592.1 predicted protein [Histoplasma mississippiense (nom. inval.)]